MVLLGCDKSQIKREEEKKNNLVPMLSRFHNLNNVKEKFSASNVQ